MRKRKIIQLSLLIIIYKFFMTGEDAQIPSLLFISIAGNIQDFGVNHFIKLFITLMTERRVNPE
jgi:hypothetical protein